MNVRYTYDGMTRWNNLILIFYDILLNAVSYTRQVSHKLHIPSELQQ